MDEFIEVRRGEILCFLGPNGAGKTTTINILTGALGYEGGEVVCEGILFRLRMLLDGSENGLILPFYFERNVVKRLSAALGGGLFIGLSQSERAFSDRIAALCGCEAGPDSLSQRELETLAALATGASNKDIALRLPISVATLKTHMINIYSKLQVGSRVAAVEEAKRRGLIGVENTPGLHF
jgi:DNA-binding CsgD family transcriptional regulator